MKNPYLGSILVTCLVLSILFTASSVVGEWASLYSISHYGSTTLTSFTEQPNVFADVSRILEYVQVGMLMPLYPAGYFIDSLMVAIPLEYVSPIIVFVLWFAILYAVTYLYARFLRKNLVTESKSHGLLIAVCILTTVLLSGGQMFYTYEQEMSFIPKPITFDSVSPASASNGEYITLSGSGFSAQDITVWLVGKQGGTTVYGFLWSGRPAEDGALRIPFRTLGLCDNALQNPCRDALENFGSGRYAIEIRGGANTPSIPLEVVGTATGITFSGTPSKSQGIKGTVYAQSFTIPINYLPLADLTSMMEQNTGMQIDKDMTDANFDSIVQAGEQETLELVSFDQYVSTDEARKVIDGLGYRPANVDEFISFVRNEYKSFREASLSAAIISKIPISGTYKIPVFQWVNGVPTITLRNAAQYQEASEFSLVVKKKGR